MGKLISKYFLKLWIILIVPIIAFVLAVYNYLSWNKAFYISLLFIISFYLLKYWSKTIKVYDPDEVLHKLNSEIITHKVVDKDNLLISIGTYNDCSEYIYNKLMNSYTVNNYYILPLTKEEMIKYNKNI
jgi:hypothetical protein